MTTWKNFTRRTRPFVLLSLLVISACDTGQQSEKESEKSIALVFSPVSFEKRQKGCERQACAEITVDYLKFEQGDELNESLNEKINARIAENLAAFQFGTTKKQSLDELASLFIENYEKFKLEFPESQTGWYVRQKVSLSYKGKTFVSIQFDTEAYTGGAHPITERSFLNVDKEGNVLDRYDHFVISESKLKDLAEDLFRKKQNIKPSEKLSDAGFIFKNDQFSLPKSMGFTKAGMVLYYNSYEVADYASGAIEIMIPFNQLKGIYRHKAL